HRMADGAQLGPSVEIHSLDHKSVALPMAARISEPRRRPIFSMRHTLGVHGLKHRALFEKEGDVLIVLNDLHRMWSKRPDPAEGHAASGVVTLPHLVIVVPLRLPPRCERKRIRLPFVARAIRVCEGASHILSTRPVPNTTEIGLAIRKTRSGPLQVRLRL